MDNVAPAANIAKGCLLHQTESMKAIAAGDTIIGET